MRARLLFAVAGIIIIVLLAEIGIPAVSAFSIFPTISRSDEGEVFPPGSVLPRSDRAADGEIVWSAYSVQHNHSITATGHGRVTITTPHGSVGMMLTGTGRGRYLTKPGPMTIRADATRLEMIRHGYTEWYLCDSLHIEQGMEIFYRPGGSGLLTVSYTVDGDLTPVRHGKTLVFSDRYGPAVSYGGLAARDADGRYLPVELDTTSGNLFWRINDSGAVYPVTIDPFFFSQQSALTSPAPLNNGRYGISVSLDGDTLFVGEDGAASGGFPYAGRVHVYQDLGGTGDPAETLEPPDPSFLKRFGSSVAVHEGTAVIGANLADPGGIADAGEAYVYRYSGGTWNHVAVLNAMDKSPGAGFGTSVAVREDTIVVGAPSAALSGKAMGQVYVFRPDGETWSQVGNITSPDETGSVFFGNAVALSGDTVVIGAYQAESGSAISAPGKAYVYRDTGGIWNRTANLTAWTNRSAGSRFGSAVSIDNDTIVIGALYADLGALSNAGQAYMYHNTGGSWSGTATLIAPDRSANAYFGSAVSLENDTVVVGAYNVRKAYVYQNSGGSWTPAVTINATDFSASSGFGSSVSLHGTSVATGAPLASVSGVSLAGKAYVFVIGEIPAAPSVISVSPSTGINTTSVPIGIAGENFNTTSPGTLVRLVRAGYPDTPAEGVLVESPHMISCTLPLTGAAAGAWDVTVTNPDGQMTTGAGLFSVTEGIPAPVPVAISPSTAPNTGPVTAVISGTNFNTTPESTTVTLTRDGESPIMITGITPISTTAIDCLLPITGAAPGAWTVVVTNPDGQEGMIADGILITSPVPGPVITGITPTEGSNDGMVDITDLAGTGFTDAHPGTVIMLNRTGSADVITAGNVDVVSPVKISCTFDLTGASPGDWNVVVINPDGQQGMAEGLFTITAAIPPIHTTIPPSLTQTPSPAEPGEPADTGSDGDTCAPTNGAATLPELPAGSVGTFLFPAPLSCEIPLAITRIDLEPVRNLHETTVTITRSTGSPPRDGKAPVAGYARIEVPGVNPDAIRTCSITFSLSGSWLDDHRLDPHDIVMFRHTDGRWQELPTTYRHTRDDCSVFTATSPVFSDVAVSVRDPVSPAAGLMIGSREEARPDAAQGPATRENSPVADETTMSGAAGITPVKFLPAQESGTAAPESSGPPVLSVALAALCLVAFVIWGLIIRRWYLRRQNPALFRKYD